jgi:hypothetical protein
MIPQSDLRPPTAVAIGAVMDDFGQPVPVTGHARPLSPARRLITDFVHAAQHVPTVCLERRMRLLPLAEARAVARPRPGWCAIFTKAFAVVSARTPVLRQSYLSFPRPRLYESPITTAAVAVERPMGGEIGIGFALLREPQDWPVLDVHNALRRSKTAPETELGEHRRALRTARLPWPLRSLVWWFGLNVSGQQRVRNFGTFGVTAPTSTGASLVGLLSPVTATLTYGVVSRSGRVDVRLTFDHRVMDGCTAGRALADLEAVLLSEVRAELEEFWPVRARYRSGRKSTLRK